MIWKSNNGEENNKIFIGDTVINDEDIAIDIENKTIEIKNTISVGFIQQNIYIQNVSMILYNSDLDIIALVNPNNQVILTKELKDRELASIDLNIIQREDNSVVKCLSIDICELPMFLFEKIDEENDIYPKYEINISDCIYSMKIFMDESTYIDIPYFQSHYNINDILRYISELIFYFTEKNKNFIPELINGNKIEIIPNDNNETYIHEYKISDEGICLLGDGFENGIYLIKWQIFFKLVLDKTWEVKFINEKGNN